MKKNLILELTKQKYVCITTDIWSARGRSFIGVTVHFLSSEFARESFVLAFREVKVRQTYDVLAKLLFDIFNEFGLTIKKITNVVTDGGSAFCKAFRVYGKKHEESILVNNDEDEHDDQNDALELDQQSRNSLIFMRDNGEFFYSNELDFQNTITDEFDVNINDNDSNEEPNTIDEEIVEIESTEVIELPPQRRCASHLLNLTSNDFENELKGPAKTSLVTTMSKLHSLWVLIGHSTLARKYCIETIGIVLQTPVVTRWNSRFDSTEKSFKAKLKINVLIQKLKKELNSARNLSYLTTNDWSVIEEYLKVTRPVALALDQLQAETNGSQGFIMPTLIVMKQKVFNLSGTSMTTEFRRAMIAVINARFSTYCEINENNRELILAAISLPRFKDSFCMGNQELKNNAKLILISECFKYSDESVTLADDNPRTDDVGDDDDFFAQLNVQMIRRNSTENQIEAQVQRYLSDDRKYDSILNEYPLVRNVYYRHNTTLSASAVVERLFSQSLIIFAARRNRISSENFEKTLLVKYNRKLLKE